MFRHGSRHDIDVNRLTGRRQPAARYSEIDDSLVKHIRKYLGLE